MLIVMRISISCSCVALALTVAACAPAPPAPAAAFPAGPLVDLSHAYEAQSIFWPTADPFRLDKVADGVTPAGFYYASNNFFTSEHGGTHMDAPAHFWRGRDAADAVGLEKLIGPAVVVDVSAKTGDNPDYLITIDDLRAWEKRWKPMPERSIVLLRTGWSSRWPDRRRYLGTDEHGKDAVLKLHFPGLHPKAAQWLVSQRHVKAVGIDTASIDNGRSDKFEAHQALAQAGVPIFENVDALDKLPPTGATVVALPMKIKGGTGGPLRIVATLGK